MGEGGKEKRGRGEGGKGNYKESSKLGQARSSLRSEGRREQ
jgi:hypothetical protein